MKLQLTNIHPFVRTTGIAEGMVQERFLKSYDHRLLIPLSNGGSLEVADDYHTLSAAKAYVIPPNLKYRVKLQDKQRVIVVNFDWSMVDNSQYDMSLSLFAEDYNEAKITEKADWSELFGDAPYLIFDLSPETLPLAHSLIETYLAVSPTRSIRNLQLSGLFMQLLSGFLGKTTIIEPKAEQIYKYICENYQKPLTLETLSEHFHFHYTYINRLLTKQYGKSFKQLLIRVRLKESLLLLDDPSLSITEIAEKLGFFDYKHFRQSFKNYYGITPAKYRNHRI